MVTFEMGANGTAVFDINMIGAVLLPNRMDISNTTAIVILGSGTQLQVPVSVANDLLKKIDEFSQLMETKDVIVGQPTRN